MTQNICLCLGVVDDENMFFRIDTHIWNNNVCTQMIAHI